MTSQIDTEDLTDQIEDFLVGVISTVNPDVYRVGDENENAPSEWNNYLLSEDGKEWKGVFWTVDEVGYNFTIRENENGVWSIAY